MRIAITGATGFLGTRLVDRLRTAGHTLAVTTRDPARAERALGAGVDAFAWDYREEPFPGAALEGAQAVFHLMGESIASGRWTDAKKKELTRSRIESTEKLIAALPASVTDFLCASAIDIYPADANQPHDESTPLPPPRSFLTRLCTQWEAAAAQAATEGRRVASLRIGLVLGESGMLGALVPLYKLGLGGPIGSGDQMLPWIHVEDLIEAMHFALEHRELTGPVNLVGPEPVPLETFSATLASLLRRPHLFRVPAFAMKLVLGEAAELVLASSNILPGKLSDARFPFAYTTHRAALAAVLQESF